MSNTANRWVWSIIRKRSDLMTSQRMVLLALADRHNQNSARCNPTIATIAADTGLSVRRVSGAIAELEAKKILNVYRISLKGRKRNLPNFYAFVNMSKGGAAVAGHGVQQLQGNLEIEQAPQMPSAQYDLVIVEE